MTTNQPRQSKGTSQGGRYTKRVLPESRGRLSDLTADLDAAATVPAYQLSNYVNHASPDVRCEAVMNHQITDEQIAVLAGDSNWMVRREVALLPYPGCADRMSDDPSAPVRFAAWNNPFLSNDKRVTLDQDPALQKIKREMQTAAAHMV